MAFTKSLALAVVLCSCNIISVKSDKQHSNKHKQNSVDALLDNVIGEVPRKDTNKFFSQMLKNENKFVLRSKKSDLTISPTKEELPTKKSTEPSPKTDIKPAISVALTDPTVYFVNLESKLRVQSERPKKYNAEKRFFIPQTTQLIKHDNILPTTSKNELKPFKKRITPAKPNIVLLHRKTRTIQNHLMKYRTKRQEALNEESPILGSIQSNGIQALPVQAINNILPAQSNIGEIGAPSDVNGINSNKVVAMVPVKVETPLRVAPPSPVAMVSQTPQVVQPEVLGTSRSNLPLGTPLFQTLQDISSKTPSTIHTPDVRNLLVRLGDQQNQFRTTEHQDGGFIPERENENEVIKLAQVPLSLLNQKTEHSGDAKINRKIDAESTGVKLDHFPGESKDTEKKRGREDKADADAKIDKSKEDINTETLKSLQTRLTGIISKLEAKVNKKEGQSKQEKQESSLSKLAKHKPSEKSLKFLKQRLNNVLKKFNSKPGAGQPFTIGKEWANVMSGTGTRNENQAARKENEEKAAGLKKAESGTTNEGNWPSIASQLLRKLNRAMIKLKEQKIARSLGKEAVMYFSFDNVKSTMDEVSVEDKSGHFNDASISGRAHSSTRNYGSCGKALILNSGNLRFMDKYFKAKQTKAITLAMWVRTNVTGYVKWFAQDSGPSREFNTHTQYPLVHKNVWTHLSGTFNSSTGITRIYVDGELKTEKVNRQQETIPADFTPAGIGPEFGDQSLIAVDEVYMFARSLDPKEVRTLYDDCEFNRMVLHYGFQKINRTAGLVFDQSGLHNDGHLQGDARILDSGCDKCGSCLDLSAQGDPRLTFKATHFKHKPTKAISIGAWFNLNTTSGTHPLFGVSESIGRSALLDLHVTDGKLQWKGYNKDRNVIFNVETSQAVVPEGIWVHVLATFDSLQGQAKIFIDGHQKAVEETAKKVPIGEDWNEIKLGGHGTRSQAFGGYMDEFVLYNWELEASEISYIMKYCPDHPKLVSFTVHVPLD